MLGERFGEVTGRITSQRVLPSAVGAPMMETSFTATGSLLGVMTSDNGTYTASLRPDGTLFGEGQGITMGKGGEVATWVGQGIGRIRQGGAVSYRGAIYFQTASPAWQQLNGIAAVYEYEVDAQGNVKSQLWEWK